MDKLGDLYLLTQLGFFFVVVVFSPQDYTTLHPLRRSKA